MRFRLCATDKIYALEKNFQLEVGNNCSNIYIFLEKFLKIQVY